MKKAFIVISALCACFFVAPGSLSAESRNALLIANAAYTNAPLNTPIQEARGLKQSLLKLGFNVTLVENADINAMEKAVSEFGALLKSRGGIGFFHYGGHAVQIDGKNYLVPSHTEIATEAQIRRLSLDLDDLMRNMQAETNIVILDSCRDNPFPSATRGTTRGLAISYVKPKNSIIVYSAEAGNKARDGVFTPILTKKILEQKSLHSILLDVRREVSKATGGMQIPKNDDGLFDEIYLAGHSGSPAPVAAVSAPEPVRALEPASSPEFVPETISKSFSPNSWANDEYALWAAVDTLGDLGAMLKKVVTLAEIKSGTKLSKIKDFGNAQTPFCAGKLYPSYFVYGGILDRMLGIKKDRKGLCIARTKNSKEKSLPSVAIAAVEKSGWKSSSVAIGSYIVEFELQFKDENALKSYLDNYERASDDIATILKAAK